MYAYCRSVQHRRSLADKTSVQYDYEHRLPGKRIPTNRISNPLVKTPYLAEELEMCEHVVRGARRPVKLVSLLAFLVLTPIPQVCNAGFCSNGPFPNGCTQLQTETGESDGTSEQNMISSCFLLDSSSEGLSLTSEPLICQSCTLEDCECCI